MHPLLFQCRVGLCETSAKVRHASVSLAIDVWKICRCLLAQMRRLLTASASLQVQAFHMTPDQAGMRWRGMLSPMRSLPFDMEYTQRTCTRQQCMLIGRTCCAGQRQLAFIWVLFMSPVLADTVLGESALFHATELQSSERHHALRSCSDTVPCCFAGQSTRLAGSQLNNSSATPTLSHPAANASTILEAERQALSLVPVFI